MVLARALHSKSLRSECVGELIAGTAVGANSCGRVVLTETRLERESLYRDDSQQGV